VIVMVYYANQIRTDLREGEIDALVDDLFAGHTEGTRDHVKRDMHDFYRQWQSIHDQKSEEFDDAAQCIHAARHFRVGGLHIPTDICEKLTIVDSLIEEIRVAWHRDDLCRDACMAELIKVKEQEDRAEQRWREKYGNDSDA